MTNWAEIKKINSTLGTTEETSIDNMIRDTTNNETLISVLKEILDLLGG